MMKNFRIKILLTGLFALGLSACGAPPSKPSSVSGGGNATLPDGTVVDKDGNVIAAGSGVVLPPQSVESFKLNIYEPIMVPFCVSCHSDTFASASAETAHTAFVNRTALDAFPGLELTTMVKKIEDNHNCWEAEKKKCVTKMKDSIHLWLEDLKALGFVPKPVVYPNSTQEVALAGVEATTVPIPNTYAPMSAVALAAADIAAPFVKLTDDPDGPLTSYIAAPAGTAPLNAANQAQAAKFKLAAQVAGTYTVWLRVKTPADTSNEFFIRPTVGATVGAIVPMVADVTGMGVWKWQQVMVTANGQTNPLSLNVAAAGDVLIDVMYREGGARVAAVVITSERAFNGELFSNSFLKFAVPLKVPGADGAKIVATVWEKGTAEGKKALGVKDLKLESPVPIMIKGIKPLFNKIFDPTHSLYTEVNGTFGGPDPTKAIITTNGSTSTTWLTDIKTDMISFSFNEIKAAP